VQVWEPDTPRRRRARPEAVLEAGWEAEALRPRHRAVVAGAHRGRGREVISLDWTSAHHERGRKRWAVHQAWDHVEHRLASEQTVVTAVVANRGRLAGSEVVVQPPDRHAAEMASWPETGQARYTPLETARGRLLALWHDRLHRLAYQQRTESARAIVTPRDQAGHCPHAHDACDHGVLHRELTRGLEHAGTHWVSELERARHLQWQGQWRRVEAVAEALRHAHPERFRRMWVRCRHGETTAFWAVTNVGRLQRSGRKRLVIGHASAALRDAPRLLLTDARHWESGRVIETWSDRWTSAICQEFGTQVCGLETAQVRKEAAVKRHFRLRGGAQALLQQAPASGSATARLTFAQGATTIGQKVRTIAREALQSLLKLVEQRLAQGHSWEHMLEVLMPV
jgi:hypothetical protein